MDNPSRSERSRKLAIEAAFTIIARDGPGQLTFDAIARESGISKGGLMHQFRTKGNVLKALLEHQTDYFENFFRAASYSSRRALSCNAGKQNASFISSAFIEVETSCSGVIYRFSGNIGCVMPDCSKNSL